MAKLVKMTRGDEKADVHPDEVDNMAAGGWVKAPVNRAVKKAAK